MKFSGVFLFAIIVGVMAATLYMIDQFLSPFVGPAGNKGFMWVSSIAWATYFLAGGNVFGGVKATIGFVIGIIATIGIFELAGVLEPVLGFYAVPLAIFVIIPLLICLENVPPCNFLPAMFLASGTYSGIIIYVPNATPSGAFGVEMCYALLGFVFGWLTLIVRAPIQKKFAAPSTATPSDCRVGTR